jgi:hypothetical protein
VDKTNVPLRAARVRGDGVVVKIGPRSWAPCAAILVLLASASTPAAIARDGGDDARREARVAGTCATGASSTLRLRSRDGEISLEFEVRRSRRGERWRVVLVHERRVAWRGSVRTGRSRGSFRVRRTLRDYAGSDRVTARAAGPRGLTCEASALLAA